MPEQRRGIVTLLSGLANHVKHETLGDPVSGVAGDRVTDAKLRARAIVEAVTAVLADGRDMTARDLSRAAGLKPGTATSILTTMETAGLLTSHTMPSTIPGWPARRYYRLKETEGDGRG